MSTHVPSGLLLPVARTEKRISSAVTPGCGPTLAPLVVAVVPLDAVLPLLALLQAAATSATTTRATASARRDDGSFLTDITSSFLCG